jgi:hypothetical protein
MKLLVVVTLVSTVTGFASAEILLSRDPFCNPVPEGSTFTLTVTRIPLFILVLNSFQRIVLEPILRLLNLQLQRQRSSKEEEEEA